nr:PREDICTED: protocadherin beta-18-like [Stegastes partitus]
MAKGSLVGNIAQDLGLDVKRLQAGKARIHTGDSAEYIQLNKEKGLLIIKEKIDREALCGQTTPCALHFQIALENPIEIFPITVEITDINDNAPVFDKEERRLEISESATVYKASVKENSVKGTLITKVSASDADKGSNGEVSYIIENSMRDISKLFHITEDGQLILNGPVDYEKAKKYEIDIEAVDRGVFLQQYRLSISMYYRGRAGADRIVFVCGADIHD